MICSDLPTVKLRLAGGCHVVLPRDVYLSASMTRSFRMREYALQLATRGFRIVSTWMNVQADEDTPEARSRVAQADLAELDQAGLVLAFSERPGRYTGGRHVELGYALALRKLVIVIGPDENVFHCHPGVVARLDGWGAFLQSLER